MERDGDVGAEFINCALIGSCFTDKYKMCKDDILMPLFCNASNFLENELVMDSQSLSPKSFINSGDTIGLNFLSPKKSFVGSAKNFMSNIDQRNKILMNDCLSPPTWEKPPQLQSFSPDSQKLVEKLYVQDSFLNRSTFDLGQNVKSTHDNNSLLNAINSTKPKFHDCPIIEEKLLLDYEAETSSSSFEDDYYSLNKNSDFVQSNTISDQSKNTKTPNNISNNSTSTVQSEKNMSPSLIESSESQEKPVSPLKNDRLMPDLLPTIISLDDDSVILEKKEKKLEVIDVPVSPEMPTLIPFTSEVDEIFRVKIEVLSDESQQQESDCRDNAENIQPKVMLRRINLNNSIFLKGKKNSVPLPLPVKNEIEKRINEGPEIEEIEGVRFFQFLSKHEMEVFNANLKVMIELDSDSLNEIIPTKTTDITQIKGWRTKYFAPDSQFSPTEETKFDLPDSQLNYTSLNFDNLKMDESSQENKVSGDQPEEQNNNTSQQGGSSETSNLESKDSSSTQETANPEKHSNGDKNSNSDHSEEEFDLKKVKIEKIDKLSGPRSAFISEELEKFLTHSSTLNVSFLQSVNPNIIPIAPDASILSIGKLKKIDRPHGANFIFKRKKETVIEKLEIDIFDIDSAPNSPGSSSVLALDTSPESSSTSSSSEDIPVTNLKQKRTILRKRRTPNKKIKGKSADKDLDQDSKRVVLRLKKDGDGVSKGYKVSNISCKNENFDSSTTSDFPYDTIPMPEDGSLPVIKQTLFGKKNEPQLLDEFLNNLNMYGTRKDVAMLVQSNQSYFNEGPTLSPKNCVKAISVLVSNKNFLELKQKSKKKLKAWQKYIPKKLSEKQKMKLKSPKRKTRVQSLLDDAVNIMSAEMGKRSIRLPARYLDSAVLAAGTEWVSPVITIQDTMPKKNKSHSSPEVVNLEPEEPVSSTSSSSSSSEDYKLNCISTKNKNTALENKISDLKTAILKKKIIDHTTKSNKCSAKEIHQIKLLSNISDNDNSSSSCSLSTIPTKRYFLPKCCKHTSRTAVFNKKLKKFTCMHKFKSQTVVNSNFVSNTTEIVEKNKWPSVNYANTCNKVQDISSKLIVSNPKVYSAQSAVPTLSNTENAKDETASKNNVSKSILFVLPPGTTPGNNPLQAISLPKHISDKNSKNISQKVKPPILCKPHGSAESISSIQLKTPPHTNASALSPFNQQDTSAALKLSKMAEKHVLSLSPSNFAQNNERTGVVQQTSQLTDNTTAGNSAGLSKILAYKVGGNLFVCNTAVKNNEINPVAGTDNVILPKIVTSENEVLPIITSVQSHASNVAHQMFPNGETVNKVVETNCENFNRDLSSSSVPNQKTNISKKNDSVLKSKSKTSVFPKVDHNYIKIKERRRKSPISKKYCDSSEDEQFQEVKKQKINTDTDDNIDIETVDLLSFSNDQGENTDAESDSDISVGECDHIFRANVERLSYMLEKKSLKEKKRRLIIKTHFEDLKFSSKSFNNAKSAQEILQMAITLVNKSKRKEELLSLAKTRLKIHNAMLLERLKKSLQGIPSPITRNYVQTQIINKLACDREIYLKDLSLFQTSKTLKQQEKPSFIASGVENKISSADSLNIEAEKFKQAFKLKELPGSSLASEPKIEETSQHAGLDLTCYESVSTFISPLKKQELQRKAEARPKEVKNSETLLEALVKEKVNPDSIKYLKKLTNLSKFNSSLNTSEKQNCELEDKSISTTLKNSGQLIETANRSEEPLPLTSKCHELKKLIQSSVFKGSITPDSSTQAKDSQKSPEEDSKNNNDEIKKMRKNSNGSLKNISKDTQNSDSDTEDLASTDSDSESSDSSDSVKICDGEDSESSKSNATSPSKTDSTTGNKNAEVDEKYPGVISLFHPKVFKENKIEHLQTRARSSGESSQQKECSVPQFSTMDSADNEETDEIAIIGSKIVNQANSSTGSLYQTNSLDRMDHLKKFSKTTTSNLLGPCVVQKVQLKNGKTVFAYKTESANSVGSCNANCTSDTVAPLNLVTKHPGVRNLNDVFQKATANSSNQSKQPCSPVLISLSDSEDESQEPQNCNSKPLPVAPSSRKVNEVAVESDSDDDRMHIDESYTQDDDKST